MKKTRDLIKTNQPLQNKSDESQSINQIMGPGLSKKQTSINQQIPFCQIHNIEITLMCCVSQWHCEALCVDCIPEHTESHAKNRTQPVLKKFDQTIQECLKKCAQFKDQLKNCKFELMDIMREQFSDNNLENLQLWRNQIIQSFEEYFTVLQQAYSERAMQAHKKQIQKLDEMNTEIEKLLSDVGCFDNDLNSQTQFVKGISSTLKINVDDLVSGLYNEIKRIQNTYVLEEELKLNLILVKYLNENRDRLVFIDKPILKDFKNNTSVKDKPKKVKVKSNKCSECGNDMVYVSEFKKHLECPHCNKVKRPNKIQ